MKLRHAFKYGDNGCNVSNLYYHNFTEKQKGICVQHVNNSNLIVLLPYILAFKLFIRSLLFVFFLHLLS